MDLFEADMYPPGIRYEWQTKDGQWVSQFAQSSIGPFRDISLDKRDTTIWTSTDYEASKHASEAFITIRCLFDTLMQVEYTSKPFAFLGVDGPKINVKEITYDHLTQVVKIQDQTPTRVPAPTLVSINENFAILQDNYGQETYFEPVPGLMSHSLHKIPPDCAMCDYPPGKKGSGIPGWFGRDPTFLHLYAQTLHSSNLQPRTFVPVRAVTN
jgi:hypothetical protein